MTGHTDQRLIDLIESLQIAHSKMLHVAAELARNKDNVVSGDWTPSMMAEWMVRRSAELKLAADDAQDAARGEGS